MTYQEVVGTCNGPANGIGCSTEDPNNDAPSGNPNDIVNCFNVTNFGVSVPFRLDFVRFWIGDSATLVPDLQLNIWVGNTEVGPIANRLIYSEELFGFTVGENLFDVRMGARIRQSDVCIGITSRSTNAGLRVQAETPGLGENSFLRSPECGIVDFTSLSDLNLNLDFCIEALVSFVLGG